MRDAAWLAAALALAVAGMGWLALAMDAHWPQVFGPRPRARATVPRLRALGAGALSGSLLLCLTVDHPTMAVLVWVMALAGAALAIAFTLARRARWLRVLLPTARSRT